MFDLAQFREYIIKPSTSIIKEYSEDAEELLVFTCAVESLGGKYLKQVGGPACGIYQMEPFTHDDLWRNYIKHRTRLTYPLGYNMCINQIPLPQRLVYDLAYATVMARIHYLRVPEALPNKDDVDAMWDYYKTYYNTSKGKATKAKSLKKYKDFTTSPNAK